MLLVPRLRRWGAWLSGLLLVAFLVYIGINYNALQGEECNCFPWIKRAVGVGFFVGDLIMLALAVLAGVWARASEGKRGAVLVLAAVTVFALVSYGVHAARMSGIMAPETIQVDGKAFPLRQGRVMLYFFDPECSHCFFAAKEMSAYAWKDVRIVAVPTERPEFAQQFLNDTGLKAPISTDVAKLRAVFQFGDPPFAVALNGGRVTATMTVFEGAEPRATLDRIGFISPTYGAP
jgi:hypothetical protein